MAKVDNNATPVGAPLTDIEIKWGDAITMDLIANDKALELAMNNYKNTCASLYKKRADMWKQLLAVRGVNNEETDVVHTIKSVRGEMCIVAETTEEKQERAIREDVMSHIMNNI